MKDLKQLVKFKKRPKHISHERSKASNRQQRNLCVYCVKIIASIQL